MKRGGRPKRSTALRRTGRLARTGGLTRSPIKRKRWKRKPPKPKPAEGPLTPDEWRRAIYLRERRRSSGMGGSAVLSQLGRALIPIAWLSLSNFHHVVAKSWLRREGLHHLVWDPRNGMLLTGGEHAHHENGSARIPRSAIPAEALEFIAQLPPSVHAHLESKYPTEGGTT